MRNQNRLILKVKQKLSVSPEVRIILIGSSFMLIASAIVFIYMNVGTPKETKAALGMHGAKTVSTTNVILNEFTTLTSNASAGSTSISVASSSLNANSRFSGSLSAGELV